MPEHLCQRTAHPCVNGLLATPSFFSCCDRAQAKLHPFPLLSLPACRKASSLVGSSALAITAGTMAGATLLALTVLASSQHTLQPMRAWPDWSELAAGGRSGWFATAVELLAVIPVLLVASLSHCALLDVVSRQEAAVCLPAVLCPPFLCLLT